jgi:hypothetical protein
MRPLYPHEAHGAFPGWPPPASQRGGVGGRPEREMRVIGLYRGKSVLSRAIRWWHRTPYSHAAWIEPGTVIEAWKGAGVMERSSIHDGHTDGTRIDLFECAAPLTAEEHEKLLAELRGQIGRPYDLAGVLGFVTRRDRHRAQAWFCSELVAWVFERIGRPLFRAPPHRIYPGMLAMSNELAPAGHVVCGDLTEEIHENTDGMLSRARNCGAI